MLRALLATRLDYVRATQLAASLGQGIAILFVVGGLLFALAGFFVSPFLFFIALFVYLGAQQESNVVQMRSLLRGIPLRAAMVTRFRTVDESAPLSAIVQELLAGYQQDFPVVRDGRVVGVLTRSNIMAALAGGPREAQVGQLMRRDCLTADENDMLDQTFERMRETQCSSVPVLRGDTLVGMLTLENVGEWMMVHSALRTGKPNDVLGVTRPDV
ncbi:MAG: CBS domain-containing protein [Planctomycetota bacterium]